MIVDLYILALILMVSRLFDFVFEGQHSMWTFPQGTDGYSSGDAVRRSAANVHRQLVEYLSARSVEVELWSLDSEMQIGVCSVDLEMLVRQGHQVAKAEGEHAVLEPLTGEPRGTLRLLLVNRGQTPTAYRELVPPPPPPDGDGNPQSPPSAPLSKRARHKVRALMEPGQHLLSASAFGCLGEGQ